MKKNIYVVTGDWIKFENDAIKDFDYWVVKAFSDKKKAIDFVKNLNMLVMVLKDFDKAYKFDNKLDREYLQKGEIEYVYEKCELLND